MGLALVTAIYGGFEDLFELPAGLAVDDAVCVTDDPELTSATWRIHMEPRPEVQPIRAAKAAKMCPWLYTDCTSSIWVDAAYQITEPEFPQWALASAQPFAAHRHPSRTCIYQEAEVSIAMPKYAREPIAEQVAWYRQHAHPEDWGLWECGCMVRHHTPAVKDLCLAWLEEIDRWSFQDQISGPFLFRRLGLRPAVLERRGLSHRPSARHQASYVE